MSHSDTLPRVHGRREGETVALCGKAAVQRYGTRAFRPSQPRACRQCAAIARREK